MRAAYVSAVALLATVSAIAQPPGDVVIVPPAPPVPAVKWVPLTGTAQVSSDVTLSAGVRSEWALIDAGPTLRVSADGATAVIRSESPGTYRLLVIPDGGRPQYRSVTFGGAPVPPGPSPMRDRLKIAYGRDNPDPATVVKYAMLYRKAAELAEDPTIPTIGELGRIISEARDGFVGRDALPELRKAVGLELAELLAFAPDTALTPETRKLIAAKYREIAAALEGF